MYLFKYFLVKDKFDFILFITKKSLLSEKAILNFQLCQDLHISGTNVAVYELYYVPSIFIPPTNEVAGVYSDPYVRPFVHSFVHLSIRPSVRPSQSLIRYSSKAAEQKYGGGGPISNLLLL